MAIILGIIVFVGVIWYLTKDLSKAPPVMTEEELLNEGMTKAQARKELRAQRNELRIHSSTISQATRTANQLARTTSRIVKKKGW